MIRRPQIDAYLTNKSDISLNNLSSDGQMIIDSQNGTISNCILEIPQNLNLTLENNVLTLKAGSVLTKTGDTYTTLTTTADISRTYETTFSDGTYMVFNAWTQSSGMTGLYKIENITSGSELPTVTIAGRVFFNTSDKLMYLSGTGGEWGVWNVAYPLCLIEMKSGVAFFAKDSNGNDMIFNGACFVGHYAVIYPNVKVLNPDGINTDGTLKSKEVTISSLFIAEMTSSHRTITIANANSVQRRTGYIEVQEYDIQITGSQYIIPKNIIIFNNLIRNETPFIFFDYNGSSVTKFDIRQPVRTATVEMLDKKANDSDVVKLTGNQTVAGVKTFTSSPVISNTLPQMQFVDSDFSKGTVPLSALRNTFFVLRDSTNSDIGNMGTLFQRVDESGNNYMAIVAFKNTSGSNDNAQMGIYYNTDGTSYATCPTPPAGDNSIKIATTKWVNDYFASITGYDATKTQTLKNVSGTLTWVDD